MDDCEHLIPFLGTVRWLRDLGTIVTGFDHPVKPYPCRRVGCTGPGFDDGWEGPFSERATGR
jgi:hypothetical protein